MPRVFLLEELAEFKSRSESSKLGRGAESTASRSFTPVVHPILKIIVCQLIMPATLDRAHATRVARTTE
jgi:hypothetical protein